MYSNSCGSSSFEPEIIKIGQSSNKLYSNNILTFQVSTTIFDAQTKKPGNISYALRMYISKSWQQLSRVCLKVLFLIATTLKCRGGGTFFPGLFHFILIRAL